jgi:hypothetical protein
MTQATDRQPGQVDEQKPNWRPYELDRHAHKLVLARRDVADVLNESHKMRMAVSYGLERFWGEHIRLQRESQNKATYWKAVWDQLADILTETGCSIELPKDRIDPNNTTQIDTVSTKIWNLGIDEQRTALMVLTKLCDALVWWTQRYKLPR